MSTERIAYIDILKGITIALVVAGHTIQYFLCPDSYLQEPTFRYIYGFHLQFFILLSGLTAKNEVPTFGILKTLVIKRFSQLLVPFLAWTVLSALISLNYKSLISIILHPGNGLWFLWDLFFITIFYYFALFVKNIINCPKIVSMVGVFSVLVVDLLCLKHCGLGGYFDFERILRLFPFFAIGTYMRNDGVEAFFNHKALLFALLLMYAVLGFFWYPGGVPEKLNLSPFVASIISTIPYRMLVSVVGCILMFSFGVVVEKYLKLTIITKVGTKTLGIYAIHLFLINNVSTLVLKRVIISYNIFTLLLITLILMCLSLLIVYLLEMNKWTSMSFLGYYKIK